MISVITVKWCDDMLDDARIRQEGDELVIRLRVGPPSPEAVPRQKSLLSADHTQPVLLASGVSSESDSRPGSIGVDSSVSFFFAGRVGSPGPAGHGAAKSAESGWDHPSALRSVTTPLPATIGGPP